VTTVSDELSYEAARAELRDVDSLALWERGELLADICQRWLDGASQRLDKAISEHDSEQPSG
jgi:exodeoxyribonuclease VII small subunit